jgi:lipopolysaccharide transport system ATP-binding protein
MSASTLFDSVRGSLSEETKRQIIAASHRTRVPTTKWRMLPSLITLGAMRGGTTSLYNYLSMHPQVRRPLHKEVEYFTTNFGRGETWYRAHFNLRWPSAGPVITTESSPSYLFDPRTPERVKDLLPDAKFVVLLRNPSDRAFSHYQLMVTKGHEPLDFPDALAAEPQRTAGELVKMQADPLFVSIPFRRYSYVGHGMYARQLEGWFRHFSQQQFLIIASEDMYRDPRAVYLAVLRFAGLKEWLPADFRTYAYTIQPFVQQLHQDRPTRAALTRQFDEPNQALFALLERELPWS